MNRVTRVRRGLLAKPARLDLLGLRDLKGTPILRVCKALKGILAPPVLRGHREKRGIPEKQAQLVLRVRRETPETPVLKALKVTLVLKAIKVTLVLRALKVTLVLRARREILALRVKRVRLALTGKVLTMPLGLADTRTPRPISTPIWRPLRACPPRCRLFKEVDV